MQWVFFFNTNVLEHALFATNLIIQEQMFFNDTKSASDGEKLHFLFIPLWQIGEEHHRTIWYLCRSSVSLWFSRFLQRLNKWTLPISDMHFVFVETIWPDKCFLFSIYYWWNTVNRVFLELKLMIL